MWIQLLIYLQLNQDVVTASRIIGEYNYINTVRFTESDSLDIDIVFYVLTEEKFSQIHLSNVVGITHIQNTFGQWSSVSYGVTETTGFSNRGIEKAVIFITEKLFDSYFNRYLETTCLHEAGHAIELRHTYEPGMGETDPEVIALMHPDPSTLYSSNILKEWDINELHKKYPN